MADFYVYSEEEESDFDVNSKSEVESLQEWSRVSPRDG